MAQNISKKFKYRDIEYWFRIPTELLYPIVGHFIYNDVEHSLTMESPTFTVGRMDDEEFNETIKQLHRIMRRKIDLFFRFMNEVDAPLHELNSFIG